MKHVPSSLEFSKLYMTAEAKKKFFFLAIPEGMCDLSAVLSTGQPGKFPQILTISNLVLKICREIFKTSFIINKSR